MPSVGVVLTTACAKCRESFPVNSLAPSVQCPRCGHAVAIDRDTWRSVLEAPALDGARIQPGQEHVENVEGKVSFVRNFVRANATCVRCHAEVPLPEALAHAERGHFSCATCRDPISIRKLPGELGKLGMVTHVIGEELEALHGEPAAPATKSREEVLSCPNCGGKVPLAGTTRAPPCPFCRTEVVISDAVWARLHPAPAQRTIYLWCETQVVEGQASWHHLDDVVSDGDGNLYFVGRRQHELAVWSTDSNLNLRWVRDPLRPDGGHDTGEDAALAWSPQGTLVLRLQGRHACFVLSCVDGSSVATLGGKEPADAKAHHLDLSDSKTHTVDADGTILAVIHDRLLRWSAEGKPLETWPQGSLFGLLHQQLRPLYRIDSDGTRVEEKAFDAPRVHELSSKPTAVKYCEGLHTGWDGCVYLADSGDLAKLDRAGHVVFHGREMMGPLTGIFGGADRDGNAYLLAELKYGQHSIYKVSPEGKHRAQIIDGTQVGTRITGAEHLVVAPDGTLYALGPRSIAHIFGPDGVLRFASHTARKEAEEADAALRKADR